MEKFIHVTFTDDYQPLDQVHPDYYRHIIFVMAHNTLPCHQSHDLYIASTPVPGCTKIVLPPRPSTDDKAITVVTADVFKVYSLQIAYFYC